MINLSKPDDLIRMIRLFYFIPLLLIVPLSGCVTSQSHSQVIEKRVKGADISWLPQMEAGGFMFYNDNGGMQDCLLILKSHGINTIRLRTFVNPSHHKTDGHCSAPETVAMAKRVSDAGFRIMIDIHYSDSWADPGKQVKPAAWQNLSFPELLNQVYDYTRDLMFQLKTAGVSPEWVQVGNEINPGMLLPDGSSSNMKNLSQLINQGYDAVKSVFPEAQVILHLAGGADNALFRWFFDGLKAEKTRWDVTGLSYYPYWDGKPWRENIDALFINMNDMVSRYGKPVIVVETGGPDTDDQGTYQMLAALIGRFQKLDSSRYQGVIYWEPQGARVWSQYPLSAWRSDGRPGRALDAFLK